MSENATIQNDQRESPRGLSMLLTFASCPRKWYLKYIIGLVAIATKSALVLGSNIHKAKETFYKTKDGSRLVPTFEILMSQEKDTYFDPVQYQKDLDDGRTMLAYWIDKYGLSDLEKYQIYMIETELQTELIPGFTVTDRLDLVLKEGNTLVPIDTKTTRFSIDKSFETVNFGDQATSYIYALRKAVEGTNLIVPGLLPDIVYRRGKVVDARRPALVTRTEQDFDSLQKKKIRLLDLITEAYEGIKFPSTADYYFPAFQSACSQWGCPYKSICRRTIHPKDLPDGYIRDEWLAQGIIEETIETWIDARKKVKRIGN